MNNFKKYISTHILSIFGFITILWWVLYYLKIKISRNFTDSYFMNPVTMIIPLGKQALFSVLIFGFIIIEYFIRLKINDKFAIQIKTRTHDYILKTGIFFFILPLFLVGVFLLTFPLLFFLTNKISIYVPFVALILIVIWLIRIIIFK